MTGSNSTAVEYKSTASDFEVEASASLSFPFAAHLTINNDLHCSPVPFNASNYAHVNHQQPTIA